LGKGRRKHLFCVRSGILVRMACPLLVSENKQAFKDPKDIEGDQNIESSGGDDVLLAREVHVESALRAFCEFERCVCSGRARRNCSWLRRGCFPW
jgi:hypothetical protein